MGIDFMVDYSCGIKETLGRERLLELLKKEIAAHTALQQSRREGRETPASKIIITRRVIDPEGVRDETASAEELLDETAVLDEYRGQCWECRANFGRYPFGCHGFIDYPITGPLEEWLASRLPENINCTAGYFLRSALEDFSYDGGPIPGLRAEEDRFFERKKPIKISWSLPDATITITTDQLLEMMFHVGPLQPSHSAILCLFLGMADHRLELEKTAEMLEDASAREEILEPLHIDSDWEPPIQQAANFLNALARSALLGVHLIVVP